MTITYPLSLPSTPYAAQSTLRMMASVAVSESPFSLSQQVYQHQGQRWEADITLPVMRRAAAEAWIAVMAKLNSRYGTFLMGDYDAINPRGSVLGTPLINGASQTGNSLNTKGWTISKSGLLLPGDYIQLGSGSSSRLYKVLDQVDSDSSGNATLTIWPNLRSSPADGASLITSACKTVWRLIAPFQWSANEVSTYSITFSATEAL